MKRCAWDDGTDPHHDSRRNKEHALGQQLGDLLGGTGAFDVTRATVKADGSESAIDEWRATTPTDWISKAFCESCNGGWMARIDDAAKPVLTRLLDHHRLTSPETLPPSDWDALALWAYKVSLVLQHVAGNVRSDPVVFHDLYRQRAVPSHVTVAVGAVQFTYARNAYSFFSQQMPFAPDAVMPTCSLLLRHVLIQVVSSASGRDLVSTPEMFLPLGDGARVLATSLEPSQLWCPPKLVETEDQLRGLLMGQRYPA